MNHSPLRLNNETIFSTKIYYNQPDNNGFNANREGTRFSGSGNPIHTVLQMKRYLQPKFNKQHKTRNDDK